MKRYFITLNCLLFCLLLKSQSLYTCQYWFDKNPAQIAAVSFNDRTWQTELDVGSLSSGIHLLYVQVKDSTGVWCPPQNYLFYKVPAGIPVNTSDLVYHCWFDHDIEHKQSGSFQSGQFLLEASGLDAGIHMLHVVLEGNGLTTAQNYLFYKVPAGIPVNTGDLVYHCWFDQDFEHEQSGSFQAGQFLLEASGLDAGIHMLYVVLEGNGLTTAQSYMFYKVPAGIPVDTGDIVYHCWFDEDFEHEQSGSFQAGQFLLEASGLDAGIHMLYVVLEGNGLTTAQSYMFYKVPAGIPVDTGDIVYHCWFDEDFEHEQSGSFQAGQFLLEASGLDAGIHMLHVVLEGNGLTTAQSYMFYKKPEKSHIARWEYWVNDSINNRHTTNLSPVADTLGIMALLPVEPWPIRSKCFHFHPNGDEPYLNAKNEITFRFWDTKCHFFDKSAMYVDVNVSEPIVADTLERNTITTIPAPRDNQIHWFKVEASRGDYLSFQADKACTMQLFAPSGEEVYNVTGPESIVLEGFNVWEDGTYYLAVHDVTGSGEEVSITYNWIYRYTISSYDVHLVGNGGCSTITFQGNGFNSLLDAYLVNWQNDTIRSLDIGHESNTTTTVSLNFYQENLGVYDAVFEFFEETIRINGALEVQEPVDIVLTSTVSYPSAFLRNTPCTYTYTVTNNGNMYAYAVPIFVYIASQTLDGISHIEFDGLDLPSIIDDVDLDSLSLSLNEMMEFKVWAEAFGDDHYFIKTAGVDETTGDSVVVRSNFFFLNLAPFETKTLTLKITSREPVEVWMTVPSDTIRPINFINDRYDFSGFCCAADKWSCGITLLCSALDIASLVASVSGFVTTFLFDAIACTCDAISVLVTHVSIIACNGNQIGDDFFSRWHWQSSMKSMLKIFVSCVLKHGMQLLSFSKYLEIIEVMINALNGLTLASTPIIAADCIAAFVNPKPNCPPGNPQGGKSDAVNGFDPNDIHGYLSESGSHYMRQEIQNVQYEIEFENDTTLATAAAHTIIVRDTLDATKFDLNSLAARSVTIGSKRLDLNGEQTFAHTLDLRPEIYVIAQIEQDYDPATGIIQWTIQSLDPMTMEPTDDPNQGVLPVNYYGNGVGFIDYSINLKQAFDDGTEISNRAGIIFDQNEVIMTPTWTNIVDAVKPVSQIESVEVVNDSLSFNFVSSDNRSGVWYHVLYHRNDSTDMQWQVKKPQIIGNDFMLEPELLTTEYLVMAVDSAGNREEKEMVAEYIYYYDGPSPTTQADALAQGWNWWSTYIEQNGINGMEMLQNSLGHNGLTIKSQNDFTDNYYQDIGYDYWYGSLETITNEQGYLINVSANSNASLTGVVATPANHPITIQPNWNWIGYPVASLQMVGDALANFNAAGEDVIKGQSDFASYYEGYGWYPDDFVLMPSQSYLYQSTANENKTLIYANGNRGMTVPMRKPKSYWKYNPFAYPDNLNVMAVVTIDSVELRDEHLELGAFVNGECRGSARLRYFAPQNRYYAMLTVTGQDGELVEFRLANTESRDMEEACSNVLVFSKNAVVGSLKKPYVIYVGASEGYSKGGNLLMFPNPVSCNQTFSVEIPQNETIDEIVVSNVMGTTIRHETGNIKAHAVKGLHVAGVYVIKVSTKAGNTYYGKLIVK